ncbi:MAG TPA: hypothetical protein VF559_08140 [Caulobacteraceae bacterium]|jgi:flagellar protein FlaG
MSSKVQPMASVPDSLLGLAHERPARAPETAAPAMTDAAAQADLRLIIEEAGEPGRYVYTVVDRSTGQVVSRLPREEVVRLREQSDYAAGAVFNGTA